MSRASIETAARLRARFLAAMGLSLACSSAKRPPDGPDGDGIPLDAEVTRRDLAGGAWEVDFSEQEHDGMPSCPGGNFCVVGARVEGSVGAPAPYDSCADAVPYPKEPTPEGGPDVNAAEDSYSISFSPQWTKHERAAKGVDACCYRWFDPCPGGRPLRDAEGTAIVAAIAPNRGGWVPARARLARDLERAQHWARAASFEHASVASFAQFSVQLLALGAPAELVARSHRAALDEIEHARLAFGLAAAYGHADVGPAALPCDAARLDTTPTGVLVSTVRDGCVAETIAAVQARIDRALAGSDAERAVLDRIADDEERHAELAFATVGWIVSTFGDPARAALARALERLDADPHAVIRGVVVPCLRALLA